MSDELKSDERQWCFESESGVGDSFTVAFGSDYYDKDSKKFEFTLNEPWAGDTETGFGRTCSMSLPMEQALELAQWIITKEARKQSKIWENHYDIVKAGETEANEALSSLKRKVLEAVDAAVTILDVDDTVGSLRPDALEILRDLQRRLSRE